MGAYDDLPIRAGESAKGAFTATRWNAMVSRLRELEDLVLGMEGGKRKRIERSPRRPRFILWFAADAQRLYCTEGMVAVAFQTSPDSVTRPMEPTLDGAPLRENPYWDVTSKEVGTDYEAICVFTSSAAKMRLHKKDDELELEDDERAWLIGDVRFKTVGEKRAIELLDQRWSSDIPWLSDDWMSSDGSNSGDSDDDDSDDSDSDEDSPDSDSDDSNDSDGSSSSSSGACCPTVELQPTLLSTNEEGYCLPVTGPGIASTIRAMVSGYAGPITCESCRGRLWVEFGIGGHKESRFLGTAGGVNFSGVFEITVLACSTITAWACIRKFGAPVSGVDHCRVSNCCDYETVQIPGACPDGDCSSSSSDDSDSDSGSSSSSGSGSSGGGEPCECDARLGSRGITDSRTAFFNVENHGTCPIYVNDIYAEGSIPAWHTLGPTPVEIAPGMGWHFDVVGAEGYGGTMAGTYVRIRYYCLTGGPPEWKELTFVY